MTPTTIFDQEFVNDLATQLKTGEEEVFRGKKKSEREYEPDDEL